MNKQQNGIVWQRSLDEAAVGPRRQWLKLSEEHAGLRCASLYICACVLNPQRMLNEENQFLKSQELS